MIKIDIINDLIATNPIRWYVCVSCAPSVGTKPFDTKDINRTNSHRQIMITTTLLSNKTIDGDWEEQY